MADIVLDLRKLAPFERHEKIFSEWGKLKKSSVLRITNDHEPKPLYYQFSAEQKGNFEWEYKKQGPVEWVFEIKRIKEDSKRQEVKEILKSLRTNTDAKKIKKKGKELLKSISPKELAIIEQEMINEGLSRKELRKLCNIHLEVMNENLDAVKLNLKQGHPIHTMMEEHKMILKFVEGLQKTLKVLKAKNDFSKASTEINELKHFAKHLVEADKHHKREEDVLFPELEKRGISEPSLIMLEEHHELVPKKKELYELAKNHKKIPYKKFVAKAGKLIEFISKELPSHIYKEDKILYPMAIQAIPKNKWIEMKKKCDKIGYCCFTPSC